MKKLTKFLIVITCLCMILNSCGLQEQKDTNVNDSGKLQANESLNNEDTETQIEEARRGMVNLMNSYMEAVKTLDADKVINHFNQSSEFKMAGDGQVNNYEEWVEKTQEWLQNLSKFEGVWDSIYISVLNKDVVAAFGPFHDVLTDKQGNKIPVRGEVTWIGVRNGDKWKFGYGHVYHQLDTLNNN